MCFYSCPNTENEFSPSGHCLLFVYDCTQTTDIDFFFFTLCGSVCQMKTFFSFFLPPLCVVQVLWSVCPPHSVAQWTDCIKVQSKHSSWVFVFVSICRFVCISPHRPAVNQELSNLFNELWRLDVNRMTPGTDYTVSVQVRSQSSFRPHLYLYVIVLYVIILICVSREEPVLWPRAAMLCRITPRCLCSPTLMRPNWWTRPPSPVSDIKLLCLRSFSDVYSTNKKDNFCVCRIHQTVGQLWAVLRRGRTSHSRGADRD